MIRIIALPIVVATVFYLDYRYPKDPYYLSPAIFAVLMMVAVGLGIVLGWIQREWETNGERIVPAVRTVIQRDVGTILTVEWLILFVLTVVKMVPRG